MALRVGTFSFQLQLCSIKVRMTLAYVLCTKREDSLTDLRLIRIWPRGGQKTRSRSRKVIFPLASLDRREPAGTAVSIGQLFNRKPGFSAVYLAVPCTQPYLADETKKKGAKLYRARETAYLASSAPGNSLRSQIKCHSPRVPRRIARCTNETRLGKTRRIVRT